MCLLCIRANKPHINNKVAYLAERCSCLALLAGVHILTAALLPGVSWSQTPSLFPTVLTVSWSPNGMGTVMSCEALGALGLPFKIPTAQAQGQHS